MRRQLKSAHCKNRDDDDDEGDDEDEGENDDDDDGNDEIRGERERSQMAVGKSNCYLCLLLSTCLGQVKES